MAESDLNSGLIPKPKYFTVIASYVTSEEEVDVQALSAPITMPFI